MNNKQFTHNRGLINTKDNSVDMLQLHTNLLYVREMNSTPVFVHFRTLVQITYGQLYGWPLYILFMLIFSKTLYTVLVFIYPMDFNNRELERERDCARKVSKNMTMTEEQKEEMRMKNRNSHNRKAEKHLKTDPPTRKSREKRLDKIML